MAKFLSVSSTSLLFTWAIALMLPIAKTSPLQPANLVVRSQSPVAIAQWSMPSNSPDVSIHTTDDWNGKPGLPERRKGAGSR